MKVAIITPYYHQTTRGNAVTVRRLERHLSAAGCAVRTFSLEQYAGAELLAGIREFGPTCIHAFHAVHGGGPARRIAMELGIPYLITLTGTDLYVDEAGGDRVVLVENLSAASCLVIFHENIRQRLQQLLPLATQQTAVIPQGVEIPGSYPPEADGDFVFLLPAGIRPVKNVLFPVAPLGRLHAAYPNLRLRVAGPLLDAAYGKMVLAAIDLAPHAAWLGEVPFEEMSALYASAHVVLNTSFSEGGMANSLLEAMASNRPVLAADIEGNRSLVRDGHNGLLYGGERDFLAKAELLLSDPALRRRLGDGGRRYVTKNCLPEREAESYLLIYATLT